MKLICYLHVTCLFIVPNSNGCLGQPKASAKLLEAPTAPTRAPTDDGGRKSKRCLRALLLSPLSCPVLETQRNEVHRSEAKLSEFRSETKRSEAKQLRSQLSCGGSGHHRLETKASLTRTICQIIRFHYVSYRFYVSDLRKTYTRRCPRGPKTATRATRRCSRAPNP